MDITELVIDVWKISEKFYFSRPHVWHIFRNLIGSTDFALHVVLAVFSLHSLKPKYKLYFEMFVMIS